MVEKRGKQALHSLSLSRMVSWVFRIHELEKAALVTSVGFSFSSVTARTTHAGVTADSTGLRIEFIDSHVLYLVVQPCR